MNFCELTSTLRCSIRARAALDLSRLLALGSFNVLAPHLPMDFQVTSEQP